MTLAPDVSVGQLVVQRPSRARVFERLGIDYCCGGKLPLQQACRERNLDYTAVLEELESEQLAAPDKAAALVGGYEANLLIFAAVTAVAALVWLGADAERPVEG